MSNYSSEDAKLRQMMAEMEAASRKHQATPGVLSRAKQRLRDGRNRLLLPLQILLIPWAQEIVDQLLFGGQWNLAVHPRSASGLWGILFSAFSHGDFAHLLGNSIAFTLFSWLVLLKSRKDFWTSFLIGWLGGGAVCWLLGPQSAHGLSGVVYTLFGYLLVIGWLEKRFLPLMISVFVIINYSYVIWGVLPTQAGVAWWGHLFGFLLGIFAAYGVYREPRPRKT
jgi:membrane associated rhomboid family serine protease